MPEFTKREDVKQYIQTAKTVSYATLLVLSLPILIPAHFVLRQMNLNGFWYNSQLKISKESFKKNRYW